MEFHWRAHTISFLPCCSHYYSLYINNTNIVKNKLDIAVRNWNHQDSLPAKYCHLSQKSPGSVMAGNWTHNRVTSPLHHRVTHHACKLRSLSPCSNVSTVTCFKNSALSSSSSSFTSLNRTQSTITTSLNHSEHDSKVQWWANPNHDLI